MFHSITFGEKNTWDDWHLIPSSRPVINPPKVKTEYVDLPGTDGSLDLSEVVAGQAVYENRTGTIEFIVQNEFDVTDEYGTVYPMVSETDTELGEWQDLHADIMESLHGQVLVMILEDDPDYYYEGTFALESWETGEHYSTVKISYDLYPYKHPLEDVEYEVNGDCTVTLTGYDEPEVPTIIADTIDGDFSVTYNGSEYTLSVGVNVIPELVMSAGINTLTFSGTGTAVITYRGGIL